MGRSVCGNRGLVGDPTGSRGQTLPPGTDAPTMRAPFPYPVGHRVSSEQEQTAERVGFFSRGGKRVRTAGRSPKPLLCALRRGPVRPPCTRVFSSRLRGSAGPQVHRGLGVASEAARASVMLCKHHLGLFQNVLLRPKETARGFLKLRFCGPGGPKLRITALSEI